MSSKALVVVGKERPQFHPSLVRGSRAAYLCASLVAKSLAIP